MAFKQNEITNELNIIVDKSTCFRQVCQLLLLLFPIVGAAQLISVL